MFDIFSNWYRSLRDALRDKYFLTWFIPLMTLAVLIALGLYHWLGFDHIFKINHGNAIWCRDLSDKEALVMLMMSFITLLTGLVAVGELIIFADNRRQSRPVSFLRCIAMSCLAIISLAACMILAESFCR